MAQYPNHVPTDATPEEIRALRMELRLSDLLTRFERYVREKPVEDWTLRKLEEAGEALKGGRADGMREALACLAVAIRREMEGIPDWPAYRKAMSELDLYE